MTNVDVLLQMVSLALIFVLFVTKAYKKSITTTVYVVALVIAFQLANQGYIIYAGIVLAVGAILTLLRSVVNHENDRLFKRGGC